jgi:hypothetical protein
MKLIPKFKVKKGRIPGAIPWVILGVVLVWSGYSFIQNEGSRLLELLMLFLTVWAVCLALKGRTEFLVILTGFLATVYIFVLLDFDLMVSWLATVVFVPLYFLLFHLFHSRDWGKILSDKWKIKSIYAGLACLIATEFFLILKFFPIDEKNRAIIIILVFWYFNQVYHYHSRNRLKMGVMVNLTATFLIIFGIIMYTLPFWGR